MPVSILFEFVRPILQLFYRNYSETDFMNDLIYNLFFSSWTYRAHQILSLLDSAEHITHLELDLHLGSDYILYSQGHSLYTLSLSTPRKSVLVGGIQLSGDNQGSIISSFVQLMKEPHIIYVVDMAQNLILIMDRNNMSRTAVFAGNRFANGSLDGNATECTFNHPYAIVMSYHNDVKEAYVTQPVDGTLRKIVFNPIYVSSILNMDKNTFPFSLAFNNDYTKLYIGCKEHIYTLHLHAKQPSHLAQLNSSTGGTPSIASFNTILDMVLVNNDALAIADTNNNRLIIVNLTNNMIKTVCVRNSNSKCRCGYCEPRCLLRYNQSVVLIGDSGGISAASLPSTTSPALLSLVVQSGEYSHCL